MHLHKYRSAELAGVVEYTDCISVEEYDPHNECPGMTLSNLMVRLQLLRFEECGIPLYHIYPTPPLGQDMTQDQFLSGV